MLGATILLAATAPVLVQQARRENVLQRSEPELASAYAGYKFAGPQPLPLRTAREDWASARQRLQQDAAARSWVAGQQTRLDDWIAHHGDKAQWIAGWGHDLINPATGLPVSWSWTMAEPADDTPTAQKIHGAWVMMVREANIRSVADAVRLWKLTGNAADLDWAARQLDLYAGAYATWPVQTLNGRSRLMGQSLDEAINGIALADAVRIIGDDGVPAARRQHWQQGLFAPMLANLRASNRGANNIAVWQAAASAVLAVELGDEVAYGEAIAGTNGVRAMLEKGVLSDYLWFEPSVGYGQYTQRALGALFAYLSLTGRAAPLRREMLVTQDMIVAQAALRFADGTLPAIGDSAPGIKAFDPALLAVTQRTLPIRVPAAPPGWGTLLDPDMPAAPTPVEQGLRTWPSFQAAMLQRGGWEMFTTWGQQSASHAQSDALSYELRYNNVPISSAAGTANYGSQLFLTYLRTAAAHNQPIIDGSGESAFGPGKLVSADATHIVATNPGFAGGSVSRNLALDPQGAAIETRITAGTGAHRLGDVFNTPCQVQPAMPAATAATPAGKGFNWWKSTRVTPPARTWRANLTCGGTRVVLTLTASTPGRVFVATAPDREGKQVRTAIYFEASSTTALTLGWRFVVQ